MFSTRPVMRLSMTTTSCPLPTSKSLKWLPKNPAPPVINIRMSPFSFFYKRILLLSTNRNEAFQRQELIAHQPIYTHSIECTTVLLFGGLAQSILSCCGYLPTMNCPSTKAEDRNMPLLAHACRRSLFKEFHEQFFIPCSSYFPLEMLLDGCISGAGEPLSQPAVIPHSRHRST